MASNNGNHNNKDDNNNWGFPPESAVASSSSTSYRSSSFHLREYCIHPEEEELDGPLHKLSCLRRPTLSSSSSSTSFGNRMLRRLVRPHPKRHQQPAAAAAETTTPRLPSLPRPQSRLLQVSSASGPNARSSTHNNNNNKSAQRDDALAGFPFAPPKPRKNNGKGLRGLYEGEIEPAGIRGQEATVSSSPVSLTLPHLGDITSTTRPTLQIVRPARRCRDDEDPPQNTMQRQQHETSLSFSSPRTIPSPRTTTSSKTPSPRIPTPTLATASSSSQQQRTPSPRIPTPPIQQPHVPPHFRDTVSTFHNANPNKSFSSPASSSSPSLVRPSLPSSRLPQPSPSRLTRVPPPRQKNNPSPPTTTKLLPLHKSTTTTTTMAAAPYDDPHFLDSTIQRSSSAGARTATTAASSSTSRGHHSHPQQLPQQQHHPSSSDQQAKALQAHAMELVQTGNLEAAVETFSEILRLQLHHYGPKHAATASAYHNLGTIYAKLANAAVLPDSLFSQKSRTAALECFQAAARSARDSLGPHHPNVAVSLVRVGFCLLQATSHRPALITFMEALRIRQAHFGLYHSLVANIHNNIGICYMHLSEFEQGREALCEALEIQRRIVANVASDGGNTGEDNNDHNESSSPQNNNNNNTDGADSNHHDNMAAKLLELSDTLFNVGGLCLEWIRKQGPDARRAIEAEQAFGEALQIRTSILGESDPMVIQVVAMLETARAMPRPRTPTLHLSRNSTANGTSRQQQQQQWHSSPPPLASHNDDANTAELPDLHVTPIQHRLLERKELQQQQTNHQQQQQHHRTITQSIFRTKEPSKVKRRTTTTNTMPPLLEIAVSKDQEYNNDDLDRMMTTSKVARQLLVDDGPAATNDDHDDAVNQSDAALGTRSFERDTFVVDTSDDQILPCQHRHQSILDGEESCLISESGIDSEQGKIHYPLAWKKANLQNETSNRDFIVSRPNKEAQSRVRARVRGNNTAVNTLNPFSTGNKERDSVMARARAIINAHGPDDNDENDQTMVNDNHRHVKTIRNNNMMDHDDDMPDDGLAPLGGDWSHKENDQFSRSKPTIPMMLKNPATYLVEIFNEATRLLQINEFLDAQRLFEMVLECQRHRHGLLHPDVAAALHNIGITHLRASNHNEALRAFEESSRVRKGSLGKDHPLVAVSLVKVGITLLLLRQFDEALWSFREALQVRKHALGAMHPSTARIYNNIGCVYVEFNEFKQARRSFEAALDIQRSVLAHDRENDSNKYATATTLCNLGYLYRFRDMHSKAADVLQEALELQEEVLGKTNASVLSTLDNLADSCANGGSYKKALDYYQDVLRRFESGPYQSGPKTARAKSVLLYKMSRVYRKQSNVNGQLDHLKMSLRYFRSQPTANAASRESSSGAIDSLERQILYDIRACRETLENNNVDRI